MLNDAGINLLLFFLFIGMIKRPQNCLNNRPSITLNIYNNNEMTRFLPREREKKNSLYY